MPDMQSTPGGSSFPIHSLDEGDDDEMVERHSDPDDFLDPVEED